MSSIRLRNVSFSYPIRIADARGFSRMGPGQPADPRIILGRRGKPERFEVLRNITFTAHEGDRIGIIGQNGSGKSTLLRLLHGVYTPDSGEIEINGDTDALFDLALGVKPMATGYQNIILGGLMRGYPKSEVLRRLPEIIEFCELGEFLNMPLRSYSSGMRMRLLFALATAFDPDILILDEWISAGDARFRKKASERMNEHVAKAGVIFLASHSEALLKRVCASALWLDKGEAIAFGPIGPMLEEFSQVVHLDAKTVADVRAGEFGLPSPG